MAIEKQIVGGVALVKEQRGGLYVWDEVDANGAIVARDRYAAVAAAPFAITQAEVDAGVAAGVLTVSTPYEPPLADVVSAAVARTYADVDAVYALAVGNREEEYKQAETDARAFAAAGYAGTPTAYVSGWATARGMTNQQSADAIIARADVLSAAKLSLRNQRFVSQSAMSAATTRAELDTAVAAWDSFVASTKAALV